jgi:hypothetical protein
LQGAIRDSSTSLQFVETQLEKAKADLLEHEADYLLRQSTVEQVDTEVVLKKVTEVLARRAPRATPVYHQALHIRACWWSSDLPQASCLSEARASLSLRVTLRRAKP